MAVHSGSATVSARWPSPASRHTIPRSVAHEAAPPGRHLNLRDLRRRLLSSAPSAAGVSSRMPLTGQDFAYFEMSNPQRVVRVAGASTERRAGRTVDMLTPEGWRRAPWLR